MTLTLVPDKIINEEIRRRRRERRFKLRRCSGCSGKFTAREMRTHPCAVGWSKRVPMSFDKESQSYVLE